MDHYDKLYADRVRELFVLLDPQVQNEFHEYSKGIMNQSHISRFVLLDYVDNFHQKFPQGTQSKEWIQFSDRAYNFRPYNATPW